MLFYAKGHHGSMVHTFKENRMVTEKESLQNSHKEEAISLESLSKLTGFPVELIHQELFLGSNTVKDSGVSLDQLRSAMLNYIDTTLTHN